MDKVRTNQINLVAKTNINGLNEYLSNLYILYKKLLGLEMIYDIIETKDKEVVDNIKSTYKLGDNSLSVNMEKTIDEYIKRKGLIYIIEQFNTYLGEHGDITEIVKKYISQL